MVKWLRWQGLVAFVIIVVGLAAVWMLLIDNIVKVLIERQGSALVGAKVELDRVELTIWPTFVTLNKLQVTDPDNPMTNLLQADVIAFGLDTLAAIEDKIIIDEMTIEGVGFRVPRESSGALETANQPSGEEDKGHVFGFELPTIELPSAEELLSTHEFETVTKAKQLKVKIANKRNEWQELKGQLPDKSNIDAYKKRYQEIKEAKGTLKKLAAVKQLKQMKKDIKRDIDKVKAVKAQLEADVASLKADYKDLKATSKHEVNELVKDLGLDSGSLGGIGRALIGKQFSSYIDQTLQIYRKARPHLDKMGGAEQDDNQEEKQRFGGTYVEFINANPSPEFLIRQASLAGQFMHDNSVFNISGSLKDVTNEPAVLQRPTYMVIQADSPDAEDIKLNAKLNHIDANNPRDDIALVVNRLGITDIALSDDSSFPVQLVQASTNISAELVITGDIIDLQTDAKFSDVSMAVPLEEGEISSFKSALIGGFQNVKQFNVMVGAEGALDSPTITIDTDIDKPLKAAVGTLVDEKTTALKTTLQSKYDESLSVQLKDIDKQMNSLNGLIGGVDQQLGGLTKLLKLK